MVVLVYGSHYSSYNIITIKKTIESNNKKIYQKKTRKKELDNVKVYKVGKAI
jgi:hypothetical protein